jgi:hypothetical protein
VSENSSDATQHALWRIEECPNGLGRSAAQGTIYSALLPGQDDDAVSYHSTGAVSGASGSSLCNPSDYWLCDGTLTLGTDACSNGQPKWSFHSVTFRDDEEAYGHSGNSNWEGIPWRAASNDGE